MNKNFYEQNPNQVCKDMGLLDPKLAAAIDELGKVHAFRIVETWRSLARQKHLKATGASRTLKSRHMLGLAVDIYPLPWGYKIPAAEIAKIHASWKKIAAKHGFPKTALLGWDPLHLSLNNGVNI